MTRTLILMRHAKSSWDNPFLTDFERPLNSRGHRSAKALGDWLCAQDLIPDEVLSSSATRTGETLDGLAIDAPVRFTKALYHAGPLQMRRVLNEASGQCVLMLGHNPGIAEFATELVAHPPKHPRFQDYPTGATLVLQFDVASWTDIKPNTGHVTGFVVPRELTQ